MAAGRQQRWMAVADDLTGAADLAGNLARPGLPLRVSGSAQALRADDGSRVLDAATRFLSARAARQAVIAAWTRLSAPRGPILRYQKIDSTLRGQPGAEIEGFVSATQAPWVAVLPAYPAFGRHIRGGRLMVRGQPLLRTEYARDPLSPARTENVSALFPAGTSIHAGAALLRRGPRALTAWLLQRSRNRRFITFDCEDDAQLRCVAEASLAAGCRHFAGASGLGAALALRLHGPLSFVKRPSVPLCLLLGSLSATAFEQLARAQKAGLHWFPVRRFEKSRWVGLNRRELTGLQRRHRQGSAVALSSLASRQDLSAWLAQGRRKGYAAPTWADRSLRDLARQGLSLAGSLRACLWFAAGGHTLASFLEVAGLNSLQVQGLLQAGVPLARAQGPGGEAWVASRPGGFGGPDDLLRLIG